MAGCEGQKVRYILEITEQSNRITIDFGDNQASRGAVIAGLRQAKNITTVAYDIDENDKRWGKEF
jgi:hypothetical protein